MLFCPSFTQSERFLHTDQLITRLRRVEPATCSSHDGLHSHVVGKRDRDRVQIRCIDLVGSDLPHNWPPCISGGVLQVWPSISEVNCIPILRRLTGDF